MSSREPETTSLIGPYVLGACSPEEAAEVRARMVVDAAFRAEVESYAVVHDALLRAPDPVAEPGPATKAGIMSVVREEASLFAAATDASRTDRAPASPVPSAASTVEASPESVAEPVRSPRKRAFAQALRSPTRVGALVAVVVALVVGVSVLSNGGSGSGSTSTNVTAQVMGSAKGGKAELIVDKGQGRVKLSGFPAAGAGRKYEVWLRTGKGAPRPTRVLFDVDKDGNGEAAIPDSLGNVDDVLLTSEPAGGSKVPSRPPVMLASVPA